MKHSTVKKYTDILLAVKNSGQKLSQFCSDNGINYNSIVSTISSLKKQNDKESEDVRNLISLYNEVVSKHNDETEEEVDTDDRAETSYIRDKEGKIKYYKYQIFRRNKAPLCGKLTREEMNTIHRLYSYYGDALTQRVISRHFVDLSLIDFKRILRAFNITKASAPFAPHMFEECSEDELRDIQLREKENSFLRRAEEDQIKNTEKLLKQYAQENIELKNKLNFFSNLQINIDPTITAEKLPKDIVSDKVMNLYISDMHLGSYTVSGSLFDENRKYGFEEAQRRLSEILKRIQEIGTYKTINLVLMGDNIDCCGITGKTGRLDHNMPNNMDAREQGNKYIELMLWFIKSIVDNKLCANINVYSVPEGNHGATFEYMCNKALLAIVNSMYPEIGTILWEKFYGRFDVEDHTFIILHGKDGLFMKKPFPLNLDDRTKVMLYEWLNENQIYSDKVHFVKGDLHSDALSSCKRIDYRNVLSLYGASDYSNYNYSKNSYGMSYDLVIGKSLLRGTFENL